MARAGTALQIDPAPAGDRPFVVQSADVRGHARLRLQLLFDYARDPLVLVRSDDQIDHVVLSQSWVHLGVSYALHERFLLSLDAPITLLQSSADTVSETALVAPSAPEQGDLRLGVRARLLGPVRDGVHFAMGVEAWLPIGAKDSYVSDEAFRGFPFAVVGGVHARFSWSVQSGLALRPSQRLAGALPTRVGSAWTLGAALGYLIDAAATLSVGPELWGSSVVIDGAKLLDSRSTGVHALLGTRWRIGGQNFVLGAAAGPGIGQAAGTPDYRIVASLGFIPERDPKPPDADKDRIPDVTDACVDWPGVPSSDPAMNGCPPLPPDRDGDAIPDSDDACPTIPGEPRAPREVLGCPKQLDADGDKVPDASDACPHEAGTKHADPKRNGCPAPRLPESSATLVAEQIAISQQVQFETDSAVLLAASDGVLSDVARVLALHPELELLEIQGHTDDTGTPELNARLGHDRATAVMNWLIAHGIAKERLTARGFGADKPIAENTSEAGRSKNRRVEFQVLRRSKSDEKPAGSP